MVHIVQLVDHEMFVNNKRVYKDTNGNWVAQTELTQAETEAFQIHIKAD